ncbi:ion transporter [Sphingomonas sp.]|uniref:ion transporter n=1 Tax=Sphingomonas sp. TaxID=28214 RepID=UPI0025E0D57F|nr:ion transporter [Sphingomonas sp.]
MASVRLRWKLLRDLDQWLTVPMALLSLAWLLIVVWELVSGSTELLTTVGTTIWVIFILEFAIRFSLAPDKLPFLKSNWLTVLALAVPALRLFRALSFLRAARALRGFRLVRIVATANRSMNALKGTLQRRGFGYVAGLTVLVIGLGAAGMLNFENAREVEGGFRDYGHALWWTGMLIASIGTDFWPSTTEGRVLAMLLALYGLAMFGYITATFASFFVGRDAQEARGPVAGSGDVKLVLKEVRALRAQLATRT